MATSNLITATIPSPGAIATAAADEPLPLELRTDVTVEELERMSLPMIAELYNGRIVFKMANPLHAAIRAAISGELYIYLGHHPLGMVFTEAHFKIWPQRPKEARVPDVSFVINERLPEDWLHFPERAPDLAVEILSPTDSFLEVMDKVDAYLQQGAKIVWLVITSKREVLVCTAEGKHSVREVLTAPDLLPDFQLPVEKIFARIKTA